jgi:hypothetical protein
LSLPQGSWKFAEDGSFGAMIFQMVNTAREMGITLGEFMSLPEDEKAIQVVFSQIRSKMEQSAIQEQREKAAKKKK